MQNIIRLVYFMRILLHLSTYFPNTPRIFRFWKLFKKDFLHFKKSDLYLFYLLVLL